MEVVDINNKIIHINNNSYKLLDQIGRGSYASVHKAINKLTGEICAIKQIRSTFNDLYNFNNLITEIGIIEYCKCENIVRFLASASSVHGVFIVMEYCCGGSVKDVMRRLGRTMTIEQLTVISRDVLKGLDYLHANKKIHRDVKAANILLNEEGIAKLGDFGVSESLNTESSNGFDKSKRKAAIIGTLLWVPPEVARADPNYSTAIDIWSLGITIIEMGDGQPPYGKLDENAALTEIGNMNNPAPSFENPSKWPQDLLDILCMCLEKDATKRKTARELLDCGIIKNAPSSEVIKELVAEFCSSTANQKESSLFKRYKALLDENIELCSIYEHRQMKVIQVDKMMAERIKLNDQFDSLFKVSKLRNDQIEFARKQVKDFEDNILKLEQKKRELEAMLDEKRKRNLKLRDGLSKIKEKLSNLNLKSIN